MSEIRLEDLSVEQLEALKRQVEERRLAEEVKKREDKEAYLTLVDEAVMESLPELREVSAKMLEVKSKVFERFKKLIEIKEGLYKVKDNQQTHTFTTRDGKFSLCFGSRTVNDYDSTLGSGIEKIKKYISTFDADNELTKVVNQLLKLDKNGNLKPSRVMELAQLANKIDNIDFKEGVAIIQQAYQPRTTCQFVTACENKETGKEYIPLSMSRA
ncbi:MAG: DUF3164 family protein [Bacteroidales bacterium]|nr:DUF3164 family protein [Bacteroidales bacterium]